MSLLSSLQDQINIEFMTPGRFQDAADGHLHCKYAPCTIIALGTRGRYEVRTPGRHVNCAEGEAFLATEGQWLEITHHARERGGRMQALWLHVRFTVLRTVDLVSLLSLPPKTDRAQGAAFAAIIEELRNLTATDTKANADAGAAGGRVNDLTLAQLARRQELGFHALRLLCELAPFSAAGEAFLLQADRLAPVLTYIRSHLQQPITIDALAAAAGLSRSRFHAYFQTHLGRSPMDYVKQQRLNAARLMLLSTPDPVYAVAAATGFPNPFHFSREFRRAYGEPPLTYRRLHAGLQV